MRNLIHFAKWLWHFKKILSHPPGFLLTTLQVFNDNKIKEMFEFYKHLYVVINYALNPSYHKL